MTDPHWMCQRFKLGVCRHLVNCACKNDIYIPFIYNLTLLFDRPKSTFIFGNNVIANTRSAGLDKYKFQNATYRPP